MSPLLLSLFLAASPAPDGPVHDGDRVVFLGDSITVLHTWTRLIEVAVRLRHPEWSVTFINSGIGGNTVEDALARFDVDVAAHQPTVVFINFGMNDASYPPGSSGADFEKNMPVLLAQIEKLKARVVWLDTTPYDTTQGLGGALNKRRVARITELLEFTKTTGAEKKLPVVPVNDAVTRAITSWKANKRSENLIPDRIHPGPILFGVMASQVLETTGFDVSPTKVKRTLDGGVDGPVTFDLADAKAPLPFVAMADAKVLDSKSLVSQSTLLLAVEGLTPKRKYLVKAGTLEVGHFTGAQLAAGIDVMANAPNRVAPGPDRADLSVCTATTGNPWVNDVSCVFNLLFGKDQLRITMRHEKTRGLPDSVPGYLEKLNALQNEWVDAVEKDLATRVRALLARPHEVTIIPE